MLRLLATTAATTVATALAPVRAARAYAHAPEPEPTLWTVVAATVPAPDVHPHTTTRSAA